jgi:hypothetical protein
MSDGAPIQDWKISPSVYLAVFTTGINMFARFAFHEGATIQWWYKAIRRGTIKDIHDHWAHSDGFWAAFRAFRAFRRSNWVSLASITVTVIVVDQPLIQQASTIVSETRSFPVTVTAPIAPEIPKDYTGFQNNRGSFQ